ncbi:MAG: thiamine-phosphate kinase [Planctomycetota bacterium]|nr:MAG: thiamine-phosphate kinase [Planctomycetota bacterium]
MHESALLAHIAARSIGLVAGGGWSVVNGPGDDCAVVRTASGETVLLTVDQLVAGRHFDADTDLDLIARKAVARSVSDIAAMGGIPAWGLATGALPKGYAHGDALFDAMARWAKQWSCPLVGGDIASHGSSDHPLMLTVAVGGSMPNGVAPVLRSGARPGDTLWLTGPIGDSFHSGRHLTFEPRIAIGQAAARAGATAMIDLSDGLGRDSDRIARASGVCVEIDAATIPLHPGVSDWRAGVSDGEDYELLIAGPADLNARVSGLLGPIGRAVEPSDSPGAWIIADGQRHDASAMGWDH